jgi:hypothetical protein
MTGKSEIAAHRDPAGPVDLGAGLGGRAAASLEARTPAVQRTMRAALQAPPGSSP